MNKKYLYTIFILLLLGVSASPITPTVAQTQEQNIATTYVYTQHSDQTVSKTYSSPLTQVVQQKIRPTKEIVTTQSVEPINTGFSINAFENTQDFTVVLSTSTDLTITDYLLGDNGEAWDGEDVVLVREGYTNITVVTDSAGKYTFSLTYARSELGAHNYSIYFEGGTSAYAGLPPARNARDLYTGKILITDTVKVNTISANIGPSIAPNQAYTYTTTLTYGDGTPFDPTVVTWADEFNNVGSANGIQISFTEEYKINGDPTNPLIDQTTELSGDTVTFTSDTASISSNSGNQTESMTIDISTTLLNTTGKDAYLTFTNTLSVSEILNINVETVLTVDFRVGGDLVTSGNESTVAFFRSGQTISINGTLINALVPSKTQNTRFYLGFTYTPQTTGFLILVNSTTDLNGKFSHTFNLNKTYFNDVMSDIILRVQIDPNNEKNLNINDAVRTIQLKANLTSLTATLQDDTSTVYKLSEDNITVTGTVKYDTTIAAEGVDVLVTIADGNTNPFTTVTTDTSGAYTAVISLASVSTNLGTLSVTATIKPPTSINDKWQDPSALSTLAGSFDISITASLNIAITNIDGNAFVNNAVNKAFNVTLYNTHNNANANITIVFTDQAGRAPAGRVIRVTEEFVPAQEQSASATSTSTTITITAGGATSNVINLASLLSLDTSYFVYEGAKIIFTVEILTEAGGANFANYPVTETYEIYGPDHTAPELDLNNLYVSENDGTPTGVTVRILPKNTAADNIRNVTLYYRYSVNNATAFENQTDFSGVTWSAASMTLTGGFYEFVIPFRTAADNGRWVEFYIVIFDLAGYGLKADGSTAAAGEYTTYDNSVSLYQNITTLDAWTNLTNVYNEKTYKIPLGDTSPPDVGGIGLNEETTFRTNIYICADGVCQQIGAQPWVLNYHSNITLQVRNLADVSGIKTVIITYRTRTFDPLDPTNVGSWSAETNITMILDAGTGIWEGTFNYSIFEWNTEFDFKVIYEDEVGYSGSTEYLSILTNNAITIEVADKTAPTSTADLVIETDEGESVTGRNRPNNAPPQYEVWVNETVNIFGSTADTGGTGLNSIILYYTITAANGTVLLNTSMVRDNLLGIDSSAFFFAISNSSFVDNATLTWFIVITDMSGNTLELNHDVGAINFILIKLKVEENIPISPTDTTALATAKSNSAIIIIGFVLIVAALMLWYRRQAIMDFLNKQQREKLIRGTMETRIDRIKQLGLNKDYRRATIEVWKAFQSLGSEAMHLPQKYYQTVREYINKVERITTLDREVLETLAFTFEKAKYGKDEITLDDFEDSLRALEIAIETLIATGVQTQALDDDDEWEEIEE